MKGVCWALLSVLPCFTARPLCTVIRAVDSDVMTWGETTAWGRGGQRELCMGGNQRGRGWIMTLGKKARPHFQPPRRPVGVTHRNVLHHSGGCHRWDAGDLMRRSSNDKSARTLLHLHFPPLSFTFCMFHSHMFLIGPERRGREHWNMGKGRSSGLFGFKSAPALMEDK